MYPKHLYTPVGGHIRQRRWKGSAYLTPRLPKAEVQTWQVGGTREPSNPQVPHLDTRQEQILNWQKTYSVALLMTMKH